MYGKYSAFKTKWFWKPNISRPRRTSKMFKMQTRQSRPYPRVDPWLSRITRTPINHNLLYLDRSSDKMLGTGISYQAKRFWGDVMSIYYGLEKCLPSLLFRMSEYWKLVRLTAQIVDLWMIKDDFRIPPYLVPIFIRWQIIKWRQTHTDPYFFVPTEKRTNYTVLHWIYLLLNQNCWLDCDVLLLNRQPN